MPRGKRMVFAALVCVGIAVVAMGSAMSGDAQFLFDHSTGTITAYLGSEAHVIIPESKDGTAVLAVGVRAFMDNKNLQSIVIPNTVTSIGGGAFAGCTSLNSVTLPASLTQIDARAFADCESLAAIDLPQDLAVLGPGVFWGCTQLTHITIPDGVWSLGMAAFWGCSNLSSVTLPQNLWSLEPAVFAHCESLTEIIIPASIQSIGDRAFAGCSSLTAITIPENVVAVSAGAFRGCGNLRSVTVADGNPSYATFDGVVFNKQQTKLVFYPPGLQLDHYVIPDGVRSLGAEAFWGCHNLASVTIPAAVTAIGEQVFGSCTDLVVYTPENSYAHQQAELSGIELVLLTPAPPQDRPTASLTEEQLRNQLPEYQSKVHGFVQHIPGFYTDDIREFEHYNADAAFRDLVEHLLALGYGFRQIEGSYDIYVDEPPPYRGEPFIPERWRDEALLDAIDEYQTQLDGALSTGAEQVLPKDIRDLSIYRSDADFRQWIQFLAAIGYRFEQIGRGYRLHVGERSQAVQGKPTASETKPDAPLGSFQQLAANDWVEVNAASGLNMRSHPSITAAIVQLIPHRARLMITGEPVAADGYTWWPVRSSTDSGYVVEDYIQVID